MKDQLQAWNHFVPRMYLKRFAFSPGLLYHYPLLVSHESVPKWNRLPISKAAARHHLYTVAEETGESDEVERWFSKEFEDPANEAIERVVAELPIGRQHWRDLARYFAAQNVRTPANYLKAQARWKTELPAQMDAVIADLRAELEVASQQGIRIERGEAVISTERFPMRAIVSDSTEPGKSAVQFQLSAGRKLWLWELESSLRDDGPIQHLEAHRWTVLTAPPEHQWFTSDNPAIQLGIGLDGRRNLRGGWNSPGTVLMLPLSPRHLLYTQIGALPPERYTPVAKPQFEDICNVVAANAFRSIFSIWRDPSVENLRPRQVDEVAFRSEDQQWRDWHDEQSRAEQFKS